jgi:hypothetical protein
MPDVSAESAPPTAPPYNAPVRTGSALRVYQILVVLALGWVAGRLPGLMGERDAEAAGLIAAIQPAAAATPPPDTATLAAEVAAQVAAQVANDTVTRLIAAGWGPMHLARSEPQRIIIQQLPAAGARPAEATVRIVTEPRQQFAALDYDLPPGQPRPPAPPAPAPKAPSAQAHATATQGYAALRSGDKREGVRLLSEAIALEPDAPEAAAWAADVKRLGRRWSIAAYTLARSGGLGDPIAASPVLGGGQSGAAIAYTLNPLARRPVAVVARIAAAAGPNGSIDRETTEAALGLRVQPFPNLPVALDVERRIALGTFSRNAWSARVSGGTAKTTRLANRPLTLEAYGEAGVVGFNAAPDLYAGGQARGSTPLFTLGRVELDAGTGVWGGVQRSFGDTASRLDLGPSARFRVKPWPFTAQVDYRFRAAGNALPGSGPVLVVSGEF